jgi:predicted nucleic acid-binding protein
VPSLPPDLAVLRRAVSLGLGETASLAFAASRPTLVVLTDDAAARLAAQSLGLRSHGTLGVLLRAIRRRQRTSSEVAAILRSLPIRSTLYVRRDLLEEVIREVERFSP